MALYLIRYRTFNSVDTFCRNIYQNINIVTFDSYGILVFLLIRFKGYSKDDKA